MTVRLLIVFVLLLQAELMWAEDGLHQLRIKDGFRVELVHQVNSETEGSWVSLAVDDAGRLIVSDQYGGLFRVTTIGHAESPGAQVEALTTLIGHAHGLLFANDSLYVVVSEDQYQGCGLYRLRDRNGDDQFEEVSLLRRFSGTGEHGVHSIILGPSGNSLIVCAGNKTQLPQHDHTFVPPHWGEDDLLPRIWGPIGSEKGTPAPGGWIAEMDLDGRHLSLVAVGFRNTFDVALNPDGELFTFDADAEFDMNTPWYQPTRVLHAVKGADFGWRSGAGKWPSYFADTLPPVCEVGAGSPTGISFATEAHFPEKYRRALFLCDWSYGRILALHLTQDGASYRGELEEFVSAIPLPVTDLVTNPIDGAMYFTVGGRRTTSGLYRLSYTGAQDAAQSIDPVAATSSARRDRRQLESLNNRAVGQKAIDFAWPHLQHNDRFVRHAARIVLERAPPKLWKNRALLDPVPQSRLTAVLALARAGEPEDLAALLTALLQLDWELLDADERLGWLRCCEVALLRMRPFDGITGESDAVSDFVLVDLQRRIEKLFPTGNHTIDAESAKLLVYFQSPLSPQLLLESLHRSSTREEQLHYAMLLRHQNNGWKVTQRDAFFAWLDEAATWSGGLSFGKYIETIRRDALAVVPADERGRYAAQPPRTSGPASLDVSRPIVRKWEVKELLPLVANGTADAENGRRLFAIAQCFACHRVGTEGGTVGPDLTTVARRFSTSDLLDSIVTPSKAISDQFAAVTIATNDGRIITGRLVNLVGDRLMVQTNMLEPAKLDRILKSEIDEMLTSATSMMPAGLLNSFTSNEVGDLLAYLQSQSGGK